MTFRKIIIAKTSHGIRSLSVREVSNRGFKVLRVLVYRWKYVVLEPPARQ